MKKSFNVVVLISGNGSNLQAIIDAVKAKELDINLCLVLSNKADAFGLQRAAKAKIPTKVIEHSQYSTRLDFDLEMMKAIDEYKPDLVVLAGFMRILSKEFVQHYDNRMINIHPSLLPKYKGTNTHQRVLDSGDKEHGLSIHYVTNELDSGPILKQVKITVNSDDTAESLAKRLLIEEHKAYPEVIKQLCYKDKYCLK
ncbi:MAG: phosphoribosylglycinamide formyltransferase [Gammaproteobacteria bacterium]|nr:phosphoribosylglycinamide formyltransferase [Gammaproteobacteria bacterium]